MSDATSQLSKEEVLEYSPSHTAATKRVDCQGQPLDPWERMESSFMEFLDSVRVRAIQSGTDMEHVENSIVRLVQSDDEFGQVKLLVSDLMNRNQSLDSSLSEAVEAKEDHEMRSRQLEHELGRMRDQLEVVMREADDANQLLESKYGREKQLLEHERHANEYRVNLEEENQQLLDEASSLRAEADQERKEREMIRQCFEQLGSANKKIELLNLDQQERQQANTKLEDRVGELSVAVEEMKEHQQSLWHENSQLKQQLRASHDSQSRVARHVIQLESVNEEYRTMIGDTRSQLDDLKSKTDILSCPVIPLSTELHSALHSTPFTSPELETEPIAESVTVRNPNNEYVIRNSSWSKDSSDSDSFICINDPKKTPVYSERFRSRRAPLPKSKSVHFWELSDTETADEDQCKPKTKHISESIAKIIHGSLTPEATRKVYGTKNLLSSRGNVKLLKTVDGSVHLEKWRELATSKNEGCSTKRGIKRKSLQNKFGGSLQDMSTIFSDNSTNATKDLTHSKSKLSDLPKHTGDPRGQSGILGNLTEAIGQLWKWKN